MKEIHEEMRLALLLLGCVNELEECVSNLRNGLKGIGAYTDVETTGKRIKRELEQIRADSER
ncbi:hypothetical protein KAR91_50855 [Candidatus Pacearchaeota archaeon]|nr:hypothetical protein [Candidatus Pacearchaeota archaeon]